MKDWWEQQRQSIKSVQHLGDPNYDLYGNYVGKYYEED